MTDGFLTVGAQIGLHKISNPDTRRVAVSLHRAFFAGDYQKRMLIYTVYTPPHACKFGFNLFDESTGRANHIQQGQYYSEHGHRL